MRWTLVDNLVDVATHSTSPLAVLSPETTGTGLLYICTSFVDFRQYAYTVPLPIFALICILADNKQENVTDIGRCFYSYHSICTMLSPS